MSLVGESDNEVVSSAYANELDFVCASFRRLDHLTRAIYGCVEGFGCSGPGVDQFWKVIWNGREWSRVHVDSDRGAGYDAIMSHSIVGGYVGSSVESFISRLQSFVEGLILSGVPGDEDRPAGSQLGDESPSRFNLHDRIMRIAEEVRCQDNRATPVGEYPAFPLSVKRGRVATTARY